MTTMAWWWAWVGVIEELLHPALGQGNGHGWRLPHFVRFYEAGDQVPAG
jgi:hypothetical protein